LLQIYNHVALRIFLFTTTSRTALGTTQVTGAHSLGINQRGMRGAIPPLPQYAFISFPLCQRSPTRCQSTHRSKISSES